MARSKDARVVRVRRTVGAPRTRRSGTPSTRKLAARASSAVSRATTRGTSGTPTARKAASSRAELRAHFGHGRVGHGGETCIRGFQRGDRRGHVVLELQPAGAEFEQVQRLGADPRPLRRLGAGAQFRDALPEFVDLRRHFAQRADLRAHLLARLLAVASSSVPICELEPVLGGAQLGHLRRAPGRCARRTAPNRQCA